MAPWGDIIVRRATGTTRLLEDFPSDEESREDVTIDEILAAVDRVSMRNALGSMTCMMMRGTSIGLTVQLHVIVTMDVLDRDTGNPRRQVFDTVIDPEVFHDQDDVYEVMYGCVHAAIVHELDECWHVDGVRVLDPHR